MSSSTAAARVPARPIARPLNRERPAPPRLRVVAPTARRSAAGLALICVALLGVGLLVLLLLNISLGKGAYTLTRLQNQQRQLQETQQSLAEQVEAQSAPQKLAASALKLGMVPAPNSVFVKLPDGTVEGQPAIAQAPPKPKPKAPSHETAQSQQKTQAGASAALTPPPSAAASPTAKQNR